MKFWYMIHDIHDTKWMKLEDVMQNEINQSQKDKHVWFYLYEVPGLSSQSHRDRKQNSGCQMLEKKGMSS